MKRKLKQEGGQFVSGTHGFKFKAPDGKLRVADGKQYHSDALSAKDIMLLAKHYPNNRQASWTKTSVSDSHKIKALVKSRTDYKK